MTGHVEVLSLWRGVLRRRKTLGEVVRDGGYDLAELREPHGTFAKRRRYHAFIAEALEAGASQSAIARLLGRNPSTIWNAAQRIRAKQVTP